MRVRRAHTVERHPRRLGGGGEREDKVLGHWDLRNLARLRVHAVQRVVIAVFRGEIDLSVGFAPNGALDTGVEGLRHGANAPVGEVHQEKLAVRHARRLSFADILADAAQRFGATRNQDLLHVRREDGVVDETVFLHQRLGLEGREV